MNKIKIRKRDGRVVDFNEDKIFKVVKKTFAKNNVDISLEDVSKVTNNVCDKVYTLKENDIVDIEAIQNCVYIEIKAINKDVAESFASYRKERSKARRRREKSFKTVREITKISDRENANVGNGPSGKHLQIGEVMGKNFTDLELLPSCVVDKEDEGRIYIHDKGWYHLGTTTCLHIPFKKLLTEGFNTGHGFVRPAKRIRTCTSLMCVYLQSNQNEQHGGQASPDFDYELEHGVALEYEFQLKELLDSYELLGIKIADTQLEKIQEEAWKRTRKETYQAMEALIANLNSMHSRAGGQVPFSSLNTGTNTSKEGRLITEMILKAYCKGLGNSEHPIFPNVIFMVDDNINYYPGTPNHDLFLLAIDVISKGRLYPIFNFQNCTLNDGLGMRIPSMGCRTRVGYDRHLPKDKQTCVGRGNLSFTSSNLLKIAMDIKIGKKYSMDEYEYISSFETLVNKYNLKISDKYSNDLDIQKFFVELNNDIDLIIFQLLERFKYQCKFNKNDFPNLLSGMWIDSEKLYNPRDPKSNIDDSLSMYDVLKHGSLGISFIGIAETMKCLTGYHHAENNDSLDLAIALVKFMCDKADEASELHDLNFALLATPAEGLTGKFLGVCRKEYGIIEGMTDKEWLTNSYHVPVEFPISLFEKVEIEGHFIKYCAGGNITYVELSEIPIDNPEAIYSIVSHMHDNDIALGAINFPTNTCLTCGLTGSFRECNCPNCGSDKVESMGRITGYLAKTDNFNYAKREEFKNRFKHMQMLTRR